MFGFPRNENSNAISSSPRAEFDRDFHGFSSELIQTLTDQLPRTAFFAKDLSLRYISANAAMREICGVASLDGLIGCTARSFFSEAVRRRHEFAERKVMRTLLPQRDQLDYCVRQRGEPLWLLMTWLPMTDGFGGVSGVAAIGRLLDAPDRRHPAYMRIASVVEKIHSDFGLPLDIATLAEDAGTNVRQLKRDFVRVFGIPPRTYITKVRFEAALDLVRRGNAIADVAHACGYTDQSAFCRRFKAAAGVSPSEFRRQLLQLASDPSGAHRLTERA